MAAGRNGGCVRDRDVFTNNGRRIFAQVRLGLGKGLQVGRLKRGKNGLA